MADLCYCPATDNGIKCDLRYDHDGEHRNGFLGVQWARLMPRKPPVVRAERPGGDA